MLALLPPRAEVRAFLSATLLALAPCGGEVPPGKRPPDPGTATGSAKLFTLDLLPKFYIYLDAATVEAFNSDDEEVLKTYRPATFQYRDLVWENVAIRLKGNLSLTKLSAKPPFKIRFDRYDSSRRFLGLRSVTLNNMYSDPSMLREHLSYKIFRDAGVPTSRTGFVEVFVNDEPFGVYLNLETLDRSYLEFHYDDPTGNLYEGEHGDDLDRDVWNYDQDEGEDESREDLQFLSDLATEDNDEVFYAPDTVLDTPRVLDFILAETYVGHFDGYWTSHNYYIYHELASDKWTWSPWSLDQSLIRKTSPFGSGGFLAEKCRGLDNCLVDYIGRGIALADTVDDMDLEHEITRVLDLIEYASEADTRKRHTNGAMRSGQASTSTWVRERSETFREKLDCLVDGAEPDMDGDGYGPCFADCDDSDANVNPGADEVCDGIDNDCSGFADDVPECPCPSQIVIGTEFHFCPHKLSWGKGRDFCEDQGLELAGFDSLEQNDAVWEVARDIDSSSWSFGLNDRANEGDYRWIDGSIPTFFAWAQGEPANLLDWFDCVFFKGSASATWRERNCSTTAPFVCREIE